MTAQEAFSIAFDEALDMEKVAMDKKPATNGWHKGTKFGKKAASAPSATANSSLPSLGNPSAGAEPKQEQSLMQHMQQYHPKGFNPRTDKCKFYDAMKSTLEAQGMSPEQAAQQAEALHNGSGWGGQTTGEAVSAEEGRQLVDQMVAQFKQANSLEAFDALAAQSRQFAEPFQVTMADGTVENVQSTFQLACLRILDKGVATGATAAEEAVDRISEATSLSQQEPDTVNPEDSDNNRDATSTSLGSEDIMAELNAAKEALGAAKTPEEIQEATKNLNAVVAKMSNNGQGQLPADQNQQSTEEVGNEEQEQTSTWPSTDGQHQIKVSQEVKDLCDQNPEKGEILTEIADLAQRLESTTDDAEKADIQEQINVLAESLSAEEPASTDSTIKEHTSEEPTWASSDGAFQMPISKGTKQLAESNPKRAELLTEIANLQQQYQNSPDESQKKVIEQRLDQKINEWHTMKDNPSAEVNPSQPEQTQVKNVENPQQTSQVGSSEVEGNEVESEGTVQSESLENEQDNESPEDDSQEGATGGDVYEDVYRIGDNTYQINGEVYHDVSNMGFLKRALTSIVAHMKGEAVIKKIHKLNGTWDAIKRSAAGDSVRDGILDAISDSELASFQQDADLPPQAQEELTNIRRQMMHADSPSQQREVVKALEDWKKKWSIGDATEGADNPNQGKVNRSAMMIHQDGAVIGADQSIDKDGKIVEGGPAYHKDIPSADILGKPGFMGADGQEHWNATPEIKDLEDKMDTIEGVLNDLGITADRAGHDTNFNATVVRYDLDSDISEAKLEKVRKNLAWQLHIRPEELSCGVDADSHQLIVGLKNDIQADVSTKEIMQTPEWENACKTMRCPIIIGREENGKPLIYDLGKLVHLLVAGQTGKGKSVSINTILCSMLMAKPPSEVKLVLIDTKKVELTQYHDAPHNAIPVATDVDSALESLRFVQKEMNNRKALIAEAGVHNIEEYNEKMKALGQPLMPTMVLCIDELANVRAKGGKEFDDIIEDIGQVGRFAGIQNICATQVATKKVIGPIKDHFPARVSFHMGTKEASASMVGDNSAFEGLSRKGEFFMQVEGSDKTIHGQGAAVHAEDPKRIIDYWNKPDAEGDSGDNGNAPSEPVGGAELPSEYRDTISQAIEAGQPIGIDKGEFDEAFRKAVPAGWNIAEVSGDDGQTVLRATPPTATGSESASPSAQQSPATGTSSGAGSSTSESPETSSASAGSGSTPQTPPSETSDKPQERPEINPKDSADKKEETLQQAYQWDLEQIQQAYEKSKKSKQDRQRRRKAMEDARQELEEEYAAWIPDRKPSDYESSKKEQEQTQQAEQQPETPEQIAQREGQEWLAREQTDMENAIEEAKAARSKSGKGHIDEDEYRARIKAARERFDAVKQAVEAGTSYDDFKKKAQEAETTRIQAEEKAKVDAENARKKASVPPTRRGQPIGPRDKSKITTPLSPTEVKVVNSILSDPSLHGWEIDTDNPTSSPAKNSTGTVFVHNPATGGVGRIRLNGEGGPVFEYEVNPDHPKFVGFEQRDGKWVERPEVAAARANLEFLKKQYSRPDSKVKQSAIDKAQREYNNLAWGIDSAPDNKTIVASAIADILHTLNAPPKV